MKHKKPRHIGRLNLSYARVDVFVGQVDSETGGAWHCVDYAGKLFEVMLIGDLSKDEYMTFMMHECAEIAADMLGSYYRKVNRSKKQNELFQFNHDEWTEFWNVYATAVNSIVNFYQAYRRKTKNRAT